MNIDELPIEPEIPIEELPIEEPANELPIEPESAGLTPSQDRQVAEALRDIDAVAPMQQLATVPVVEVLPADFPLPALINFVPNRALIQADRDAVEKLRSITVKDKGQEALAVLDAALSVRRATRKAVEANFDEPKRLANELHKSITGKLAEVVKPGDDVMQQKSREAGDELNRLTRLEAERRRTAQEEANRRERERLKREADEAKQNAAPPAVVQQLQQQAQTAVAPPVQVAEPPAKAAMASSTTVDTYKCRPIGTPDDAEDQNPPIKEMTKEQALSVRRLLQAIVDGQAAMTCIEVNYSLLNDRASKEGTTFSVPGFEAYKVTSLRAKPAQRGRRR